MKKNFDQRIRVTIDRGGDERSLLEVYRIGNDFYASQPGSDIHQTYHESGQLHTRQYPPHRAPKIFSKFYKPPPIAMKGVAALYSMDIHTEPSWHSASQALRRRKLKDPSDIITRIDSAIITDGTLLKVVVGIASCGKRLQKYSRYLCKKHKAKIFRIAKLRSQQTSLPLMFALVLHRKSKPEEMLNQDFALTQAGSGTGVGAILSAKGGFGSLPGGFPHESDPLPLKVEPWMEKFETSMMVSPFKSQLVNIGNLTVLGLIGVNEYGWTLTIIINPNLMCHSATNGRYGFDYERAIGWTQTDSTKLCNFYPYAGPSAKQINISGIDYQISVHSLLMSYIDNTGKAHTFGDPHRAMPHLQYKLQVTKVH